MPTEEMANVLLLSYVLLVDTKSRRLQARCRIRLYAEIGKFSQNDSTVKFYRDQRTFYAILDPTQLCHRRFELKQF